MTVDEAMRALSDAIWPSDVEVTLDELRRILESVWDEAYQRGRGDS